MTGPTLYVIECRTPDGMLDLTGKQPEDTFGRPATTGIEANEMAYLVWCSVNDANLDGVAPALWASLVDARFTARAKAS